jgi:2-amino-4-hydroxy-6-hydroxymethyldihydropteridine diphosphokinase
VVHQCVICIGSNCDREANLGFARQRLAERFPNICFASELETLPLELHSADLFSNQVALFHSEAGERQVIDTLKAIERAAGRCQADTATDKIRLDIDLLRYDDRVLKPDDWHRPYVEEGVKELAPCQLNNNDNE